MKLFRKAILVIHGFTGVLSDNEFLVNTLETHFSFDVYAWTLPAHEKYRIRKVKSEEWIEAVEHQVEFLIQKGYRSIYVIGHSMGGVLTSYLATKYPQIKKIVLLSPAYDYFSAEQYIEDFKDWKHAKDETSYPKAFVKAFLVPFTTLLEFRKTVEFGKPFLDEVTQEALVLHGDKDEVVPYSTLSYVKEHIGSKNVTFTTVVDGRHVMVRGKRQDDVISYIECFLIGGRKWKRMKKSRI